MSAAAAPCKARAPMRTSIVGDSAHATEKIAECPEADREHTPLAVDVPDRATDEDERPECQQIGIRHPLLRRQASAEILLDRRQRNVDDRAVDRRDGRADDRGDEASAAGACSRMCRRRGGPAARSGDGVVCDQVVTMRTLFVLLRPMQ